MPTTDQMIDLAQHLSDLRHSPQGVNASTEIMRGIIANPQAHVDALVAAGVLERYQFQDIDWQGRSFDKYRLPIPPQPVPHVHDWKVEGLDYGIGAELKVHVTCRGCPMGYYLPNKLPLEIP